MPPKKPAPPEKGQTRLSFAVAASTASSLTIAATASASSKRPALEPLDPNSAKKPKTDEPKPATESRTLTEFKTITKEAARLALKRLEDGYTDPKSGQSYGRAITNSMGCILPRKKPNRSDNGYVQIAPISTKTRAGTTNGIVSAKPLPQNGHRLVIIAYKSDEERERLEAGDEASHICHVPICINPEHLCVEPKKKNEGRKECKGRVTVRTRIEGKEYILEPTQKCICDPPCLLRVEDRVAVPQ